MLIDKLTVIIPVHNENSCIRAVVQELTLALMAIDKRFEIVVVNDGSDDETQRILEDCKVTNAQLRIVQVKARKGKTLALKEGYRNCKSDVVATMDGDGQIDPADLVKMIKVFENSDLDLIVGRRIKRQDPRRKKVPSLIYNLILRLITGVKVGDLGCSLRIGKSSVFAHFNLSGNQDRYFAYLSILTGFSTGELPIVSRARIAGKSKFGLERALLVPFELLWLLDYSLRMRRSGIVPDKFLKISPLA